MSAHGDEPVPLGGEARKILDAGRAADRLSPRRKAQLRARVMATVAAGAAGVMGATGAAAAASGGGASVSAAAAGVVETVGGAGSAGVAGAAGAAGVAETAGIAGAAGIAKAAGFSLFVKIGLAVTLTTIGAGGWLLRRANQPSPSARPTASQQAVFEFEDPAGPTGEEAKPAITAAPSAEIAAPPEVAASAAASAFPSDPLGAAAGVNTSGSSAGPAPATSSSSAAGDPGAAASAEPPGATSAQVVSADSLPEETRLLASAHAELSRGNAAGALALLDQHAAKFPRGALAPERRAARAMALCKMGRGGDGRSEADALYGADSKSPLAEKIRRACAK